jgi:uncharacterized SAM-binding protein YcdF (DUF218 family)
MHPDAIVILGGTIKREGNEWVSTSLTASDDFFGAPGGALRVEAATIIAKNYPNAAVVASGGKGYDSGNLPDERPVLADVIRRELIEYGVAASRILMETNSNNTYQQLQELENIIGDHQWKHIVMVTNRWHVPRTHAMLAAKFPTLLSRVTITSAEDILLENEPATWKRQIDEAYESDFLKKRIAVEEQGVQQIKAGTYQF